MINQHEVMSAWVAISADLCSNAGQTCDDPSKGEKSLSDWTCTCTPPEATCSTCEDTGTGAACDLATDSGGTVEPQDCVDPDHSAGSTGDWKCYCKDPYDTLQFQKTAAVTYCVYDECEAYETVCTDHGQACNDTDKTSMGNWGCECVPPATYNITMGAYTECHYPGDCDLLDPASAGTVSDPTAIDWTTQPPEYYCEAFGQTCVDRTPTLAEPSWECHCPEGTVADPCAPSTTPLGYADYSCTNNFTSKDKVTKCLKDECLVQCASCADHGYGNACAEAGQLCVDDAQDDHDHAAHHSWECLCDYTKGYHAVGFPPGSGSTPATTPRDPAGATGTTIEQQGRNKTHPTTCALDECVVTTDVCPGGTCAGTPPPGSGNLCSNTCIDPADPSTCQTCLDPNTDIHATGDWVCTCPPQSLGSKTAAAA
eukprot:gene7972-15951_t